MEVICCVSSIPYSDTNRSTTLNLYIFIFLLVDEIQVASYKILSALYTLGTDTSLTRDRKYLKTELERHKPALGSCLGAFSSCFPVAFLEPHANKHNPFSLLNRIADTSLEAQDIMSKMESCMPTLESILSEVDQFVESEKTYQEAQHIIDVILPLLCSYLPFWWNQGPDNVSPQSGNHVTMVTADHMNHLLKNVLKMIRKNIANENAPWMTRIATYTQQIIINSSEELLKDVFLPLAERVKKRCDSMFHKEESLRGFLKVSVEAYEIPPGLGLHAFFQSFLFCSLPPMIPPRLKPKSRRTGNCWSAISTRSIPC